nr:Hypothetical protein SC2p1_01710 [Methylocystis sp. SC2]
MSPACVREEVVQTTIHIVWLHKAMSSLQMAAAQRAWSALHALRQESHPHG